MFKVLLLCLGPVILLNKLWKFPPPLEFPTNSLGRVRGPSREERNKAGGLQADGKIAIACIANRRFLSRLINIDILLFFHWESQNSIGGVLRQASGQAPPWTKPCLASAVDNQVAWFKGRVGKYICTSYNAVSSRRSNAYPPPTPLGRQADHSQPLWMQSSQCLAFGRFYFSSI